MAKSRRGHSKKHIGLPPGTLVYTGEKKVEKPSITVLDYDEAHCREITAKDAPDCRAFLAKDTVSWINVTGLHDTDLLQRFGDVFSLHPLLLEGIVNTGQRPKMEDYGDYLFNLLKMIYRNPDSAELVTEQVSMILGSKFLLSFQEVEGDVFGVIRERIRTAGGRIRKARADYLAYCLIDAIVDNYFLILEEVGDRTENLQEQVLDRGDPTTLPEIHALKREMIFLRKSTWPLRELVSAMEKSESPLIQRTTIPYLRDVYEHTIQVIDGVESTRDSLSGALDIYMTTVSNRMNEVMKVLTIIATIFIPLTFIAGVYGMNFQHMPELKWRCGYAAVWLLMLAVAFGMYVFFRRRKWL